MRNRAAGFRKVMILVLLGLQVTASLPQAIAADTCWMDPGLTCAHDCRCAESSFARPTRYGRTFSREGKDAGGNQPTLCPFCLGPFTGAVFTDVLHLTQVHRLTLAERPLSHDGPAVFLLKPPS